MSFSQFLGMLKLMDLRIIFSLNDFSHRQLCQNPPALSRWSVKMLECNGIKGNLGMFPLAVF